jgi:hypothetical protein
MGDGNSSLLTIVVIAIVALVVLWLLLNSNLEDNHHHGHGHGGGNGGRNCVQAKPDPVGGITSEPAGPGKVKICWDAAPNAAKYRVYVNEAWVDSPKSAMTKKVFTPKHSVGSCGSNCCPEDCDACVSQTKYKDLIETDQTCITYETCKPHICFMIVAYNECGDSGDCREINYACIECRVDKIDAWIVQDDCRGLKIQWNCPKCCEKIHIYYDSQVVACVPCSDGHIELPAAPECSVIEIACETCCGVGERCLLRPGCEEECEEESHDECDCDDECYNCDSKKKTTVPGFKSRPRGKPAPRQPAPNRRSEKPRLTVPGTAKVEKKARSEQGKRRSK